MASLHPPTVVCISPCTSPTAVPDSPLSSAPNSPGRPLDDDDVGSGVVQADDYPRTLSDILELPPRDATTLVRPVGTYALQRQNSELGRQSRKSRLRAANLMARKTSSGMNPFVSDLDVRYSLEEKKSDEHVSPLDSPLDSPLPLPPAQWTQPCHRDTHSYPAVVPTVLERSFGSLESSVQTASSEDDLPISSHAVHSTTDMELILMSHTTVPTDSMAFSELNESSPLDEVDELIPEHGRPPTSSVEQWEERVRTEAGSRYEHPVHVPDVPFPIQVVTTDYPGDERSPGRPAAVTTWHDTEMIPMDEPRRTERPIPFMTTPVDDVEISYALPMAGCFPLSLSAPSFDDSLEPPPPPPTVRVHRVTRVGGLLRPPPDSRAAGRPASVGVMVPSHSDTAPDAAREPPLDAAREHVHIYPPVILADTIDLQTAPTDESQPMPGEAVVPGTVQRCESRNAVSPAPLDKTVIDLTARSSRGIAPQSPSVSRDSNQRHGLPSVKGDWVFQSHANGSLDMTETTVPDDPCSSPEKNLLDSSQSSDSDEGPIGPMVARREQHRPLLSVHSAMDDLSSSDETPLRGNNSGVCSVLPDRKNGGSHRKNRVYGESNLHEYWKQKPSTKPHRRPVRRGTATKTPAKVSKSKSTAVHPDRLLPPLVVDPDQIRSIGINVILAVCNGIGSLFLSNQDTIESPRRNVAAIDSYKKLPPETEGKKKRRSRATKDDKNVPFRREKWREEWSPQKLDNFSPVVNAAVFEEALQRSIVAELEAGDKESSVVPNEELTFSDTSGSSLRESVTDERHNECATSVAPDVSNTTEKTDDWWEEEQPASHEQETRNIGILDAKLIHSFPRSKSDSLPRRRAHVSSAMDCEKRAWIEEETEEPGPISEPRLEWTDPSIDKVHVKCPIQIAPEASSDVEDQSCSANSQLHRRTSLDEEYSLCRVNSLPASFAGRKSHNTRHKVSKVKPDGIVNALSFQADERPSTDVAIARRSERDHTNSANTEDNRQQIEATFMLQEQSLDKAFVWAHQEPAASENMPEDERGQPTIIQSSNREHNANSDVSWQLDPLLPCAAPQESNNNWWIDEPAAIDGPLNKVLPKVESDEAQPLPRGPLFSQSLHSFEEDLTFERTEPAASAHSGLNDEDSGWTLAKEIANRSKRHGKLASNAAERIAAVRDARSGALGEATAPIDSHSTNVVALNGRSTPSVTMPESVANRVLDRNPAFTLYDAETASSRISTRNETPPVPQKPDKPHDHTLLADPPSLRRVNVSLDLSESIGPAFASEIVISKAPIEPTHQPHVDDDTRSPDTERPPAERSPMSDFLASRMNSNVAKLVLQGTGPGDQDDEPQRIDANDSDCSSTDELLSSLDGLVKDLDGLASARRVERSVEVESIGGTISFIPSPAPISATSPGRRANDGIKRYRGMPVLVDALNNDLGIPKGDVMISLLNSGQREASTWLSRVDEAIWRCRLMRRHSDTHWMEEMAHRKAGSMTPQGRTSVCVDVDDARVVGGVKKIPHTQKAATEHLKYDDFDDAVALYEDICWSYEHFEERLSPSDRKTKELKKCIATAHYNLGIIHLLKEDHEEALEYFERSEQLRNELLGEGHTDHVASLVKCATCRFAMEEYSTCFAEFERALKLSRYENHTIADSRQAAEILNNLGCLAYMGGEIERAMSCFRESLHMQTVASDHSMYVGSKFSCHAATLNRSITTANIGFLSLTFYRDLTESVTIFESALKDQQLLLRDAHVTLISTMEHLAVANLLAGFHTKAVQLLQRVYHMQVDAFGSPDHPQCAVTRHKIFLLEQGQDDDDDVNEQEADDCANLLPVVEASKSGDSPKTRMLKAWREQNGMNGDVQ